MGTGLLLLLECLAGGAVGCILTLAMTPELADDLAQVEAIKTDARSLVTGLSHAQFNWRPGPKRWSVAECLDHLNSIAKVFPAIDRAIEDAERRGLRDPGPFRYSWWARANVRWMMPPPKFRMKTWKMLLPRDVPLAVDDVLREFLDLHDQFAQRIRRADGLDLKRAIVQSPVMRWFRLPLGAYLAFLLAHDRRHLWQARQVLATRDS
jgi:DinB superfamily